jgi:hypothetical protein
MAASFEMAEDEELYETDEEVEDGDAEDEDAEDEEASIGMYSPIRSIPVPTPFGPGVSPTLALQLRQRSKDRRLRGVKAAYIQGRDGASAVVRMPTPVATARGVQLLSRRNALSEARLAQHQQQLRRAETRARNTVTGAVFVQHLRDVANEARRSAAIAGGVPVVWEPYLAGFDYALSATQTGFGVAAIPPSRRSLLYSTLPMTGTFAASLAREALRPPLGLAAKPFWPNTLLAVGLPTLVGALVSYMVYPGRRRRMAW